MVLKEIASWNIRFNRGLGAQQAKMLAEEYHEDLVSENVTSNEFAEAARAVRKRCMYFPRMAEILKEVEVIRARPPAPVSRSRMIEDVTSRHDLTDEERKINIERIRAIKAMLAGKLSMDEALGITKRKVDKFGGRMAGPGRSGK